MVNKDKQIDLAKQHLSEMISTRHYDVISAGPLQWEDVLEGDGVAVTIKYRARTMEYEVWEYFFPSDAIGIEDQVTFCRVASTGDNDNDDWRTFTAAKEYTS